MVGACWMYHDIITIILPDYTTISAQLTDINLPAQIMTQLKEEQMKKQSDIVEVGSVQ